MAVRKSKAPKSAAQPMDIGISEKKREAIAEGLSRLLGRCLPPGR